MRKKSTPILFAGCLLVAIAILAVSVLWSPGNSSSATNFSPVDFSKYEKRVYSQNGEDGVIEKIFEIIEPTTEFAVEFGAADGIEDSNILNLIRSHGWSGFYIEGDEELAERLRRNFQDHPKVKTLHAWIYPGNIEILFEENGVPKDFDFLAIDIDNNDYYVWRAIHDFRPKVVQIEYNASFAPPQKAVIDFHPLNYWDHSDYFGASIQSLYALGKRKGYELIYAEKKGMNLFFVDKKYYDRFGIRDNSPKMLYRPPQYGLTSGGRAPNGRGHPPYESFTIWKDGKLIKAYSQDLYYPEIRIPKKFVSR